MNNLFGVKIEVSPLVAEDKMVILGTEKETDFVVPSEVKDHHLPMKTREWQVIDLKTGKAFGDEITCATEILVTDKGMKMVTKYIDKQRKDQD